MKRRGIPSFSNSGTALLKAIPNIYMVGGENVWLFRHQQSSTPLKLTGDALLRISSRTALGHDGRVVLVVEVQRHVLALEVLKRDRLPVLFRSCIMLVGKRSIKGFDPGPHMILTWFLSTKSGAGSPTWRPSAPLPPPAATFPFATAPFPFAAGALRLPLVACRSATAWKAKVT